MKSLLRAALVLGSMLLLSAPLRAANPDKLWEIVHQECVPGALGGNNPAPCHLVDTQRGFVVLKDIVGVAQFLLLPTARISGIESPELLNEDAPNFWAFAWEQRYRVGEMLGKPLAREQIGIEVNSAAARSQLQLHLHIDCLRADFPEALRSHEADTPEQWQPLMLDEHRYWVMRLVGSNLEGRNPFKLAAAMSPYARRAMGAQSLLLTGARFSDGSEGFYLINSPVNFDKGERGSAEVWLDHGCGQSTAGK
ncbi:CDP-diacylglycerol diphosphatase [Herbaspirillum sp. RTI4]|uniref:CDP-diacylglycerol diphosphatase n=1 Tax=Herbaspirillum sp. RTI4 TaxID=3048640 RepID=UPI002AB4168D|nr:CDP-diacylglycerol diphosphatase [Herbaspirillum sp. RTI4]MDY7579718.1 CDP-diacylglycerol diphosphatase [Herbaspirillum sp. RTI4]MEA9983045.1 CDP-diacylglycerol diphosphatase [Herbaspirillum sp. RTI4]